MKPKQQAPLNILLADDDKDNRFFFKNALKEVSIATHLTTVSNGERLMDYLSENSENLPDIFVHSKVSNNGKNQTNGLRGLIISGMTRQQKIDFIQRKDNSFRADSFANQTDEEIRQVALSVDKKVQADKQKKKNPLSTGKSHRQ